MSQRRLKSVPEPGARRRALIYVRVSSVRGRSGESFHSPDLQEQACRRLAEAHGLDVLDVITDLDRTGRNFAREGMRHVLAAARAGDVDAVVCYDLSRWGRNTSESLKTIRELRDAGVAVLSTVEKVDDSPEGQLSLTMFLGMAQLYSDQMSRKWQDINLARHEAGRWHGHPPVGYRREGSEIVVDDPAAAAVIRAFTAYADGMSLGETTELIRTVPGRETFWRASTRMMLRNRVYLGMVELNGHWAPGRHPALVDEATWQRVQARLDAASWTPKRSIDPRHPFAGLLFCDSCGSPMVRHGSPKDTTRGEVHRFRCRRTLQGLCPGPGGPPSDDLERIVLAKVTEQLRLLRVDTGERVEAKSRQSRARVNVRRLADELKKVREARTRLAMDHSERLIPTPDYQAALALYVADEARLTALIEVEQRAALAPATKAETGAVEGLLQRWPTATMSERNRMLRAVVRQIRVRRKPHLRVPLDGYVEVVFL